LRQFREQDTYRANAPVCSQNRMNIRKHVYSNQLHHKSHHNSKLTRLPTNTVKYLPNWTPGLIFIYFLWLFGLFPGRGLLPSSSDHSSTLLLCANSFSWVTWSPILQHFISPYVPRLYIVPSLSNTAFQNSVWDSVMEHPYYMPSPLQTCNTHVLHYFVTFSTQTGFMWIYKHMLCFCFSHSIWKMRDIRCAVGSVT
jgi:hypothetical protein